MRRCVTGKQMQTIEKVFINEIGMPAIALMERAALAVSTEIEKEAEQSQHIWIVCGVGNNGADGLAVSRILHQKSYQVSIITIGDNEKATEEYQIQVKIAKNLGIQLVPWSSWKLEEVKESDWIVDGIFGIGLSRNIEGDYLKLIQIINHSACQNVIAIDIPSGISAETGAVLGDAVQSSKTVTFAYEKNGHYLGDGRLYCGEIIVSDIGLYTESEHHYTQIIDDGDLINVPLRKENANKGTYGKLLVVAGSKGMSGAAYLAGLAAYRTGAGLVKILTEESNRAVLQAQLPEALVLGYGTENIAKCAEESCKWATTIVMGPGLGQQDEAKELVEYILREAKKQGIPTVLDSDALNIISQNIQLTQFLGEHMVLTPHMKEMNRLTKKSIAHLKTNAIDEVKEYCMKYGVTCIMKDSVTVICGNAGQCYLNISGNSALAKGGTGDVLCGVVGGLLCLGMDYVEAATMGAYIHGRAGARASKLQGKHGVLASDITNYLWTSTL